MNFAFCQLRARIPEFQFISVKRQLNKIVMIPDDLQITTSSPKQPYSIPVDMKRASLIVTIALILTLPTFAQRRVFDNFDTSAGVNVVKPGTGNDEAAAAKNKKGSKGKTDADEGRAVRNAASNALVAKVSMSSSRSMRGFTTGDEKVDSYILTSARRYRIDPLLIYAQMHQESAFKARARSYKGASGLMQLMPATARRFGVKNIWDAEENIEAGVKYMRWLIDKFNGDVVLALAGYNAGEGAVMKYGWRIPPYRETQEYVRRIAGRYNSITDGNFVRKAQKLDAEEAKKIEEKEAVPLVIYEPNIIAVQLPGGKIRLVSQ